MITTLEGDEKTDLDTKQTCEKDRMKDTRDAIVAGREIDELTDKITHNAAVIAQCEKTIEQLKADWKATKEELDEAQKMRNDENTAWQATDKDDKLAAETVQSARDVLANFYKDNNLNLLQKKEVKQPVSGMAAGEAPPPPPPTWDGGYGGKTGEAQGIVAIMDMVKEDIVKDRTDPKADEDAALKEFNDFKKDSQTKMSSLKSEERATEKKKGTAETTKANNEKSRGTKKGELNNLLVKIEGINPNCEYFEVNYPMRVKNRQIEIDGLNKAKAILKGGKFADAMI